MNPNALQNNMVLYWMCIFGDPKGEWYFLLTSTNLMRKCIRNVPSETILSHIVLLSCIQYVLLHWVYTDSMLLANPIYLYYVDATWCTPTVIRFINWLMNPIGYRYIHHEPYLTQLQTNLANYGAPPCKKRQLTPHLEGGFGTPKGMRPTPSNGLRCCLVDLLMSREIYQGYSGVFFTAPVLHCFAGLEWVGWNWMASR